MINLREFEGKNVRLTDNEGDVFTGYAADYIFAEDNDPEEESIVLDYPTRNDGFKYESPVEFRISEIESIEVI